MAADHGLIQTSVKCEDGEKATYSRRVAENLADAIEKYGEAVVFSHFCNGAKVQLRNSMTRAGSADDGTVEAALAAAEAWQPTEVGLRGTKDPKAAIIAEARKMSPEERAAMLAELQAALESDE